MATIIVTCKFEDCREECTISAQEVVLVIHKDPEESFYSFMCTACKRYNKKQADEYTISLIEGYVTVTTVVEPSPVRYFCKDPISEHDIQCFVFDLADNALTGAHIQEELEE